MIIINIDPNAFKNEMFKFDFKNRATQIKINNTSILGNFCV